MGCTYLWYITKSGKSISSNIWTHWYYVKDGLCARHVTPGTLLAAYIVTTKPNSHDSICKTKHKVLRLSHTDRISMIRVLLQFPACGRVAPKARFSEYMMMACPNAIHKRGIQLFYANGSLSVKKQWYKINSFNKLCYFRRELIYLRSSKCWHCRLDFVVKLMPIS